MNSSITMLRSLEQSLTSCSPAAVAVSGGVDSMSLAYIAHRTLGVGVTMYHAVSPAVPESATHRVRSYAARFGWNLSVFDAGEFADERYMANPANRCFYCKSNLYGVLSKVTSAQLLSGTNMDDLGDWRPGLKAAKQNSVRHPFVEAEMTKSDVRSIAMSHGLNELAELPASPCLSSRVETGIRINANSLKSIDHIESLIRKTLKPQTVRCRVRNNAINIELDRFSFQNLTEEQQATLSNSIQSSFSNLANYKIRFSVYERGSAFLRAHLLGEHEDQ